MRRLISAFIVFIIACAIGTTLFFASDLIRLGFQNTEPVHTATYVVPIAKMDSNGERVVSANAIVVDKRLGLLVTNSHVVYDDNANGLAHIKVRLEHGWHQAEAREEWTNYNADVAIVRLLNRRACSELHEKARFSAKDSAVLPGEKLYIKGKITTSDDDFIWWNRDNYGALPETVTVTAIHTQWGSGKAPLLSHHGIVHPSKRFYFYKDCIHIEDQKFLRSDEYPFDDTHTIRPGASGSAIENHNGTLVGIISGGSRFEGIGYVIPAYEIENLLRKVREDITGH